MQRQDTRYKIYKIGKKGVRRSEIAERLAASVAHINHELVKPSEDFAGLWIVYHQQSRLVSVCIHTTHSYLRDCSSHVLKCPVFAVCVCNNPTMVNYQALITVHLCHPNGFPCNYQFQFEVSSVSPPCSPYNQFDIWTFCSLNKHLNNHYLLLKCLCAT